MSNQKVKGLGRLRYVEPTNFFVEKEGTLSDSINFPYEDYCMAVDLTIRQTNRYSCGWWNLSGDVDEITYSSKNGTLSFFGGTKQGEDGYLTTNFTDISMVNPETNTAECLGVSSINIDYDSWWYPQVTIKFVDVMGATVMQPAEKGYYNNREMGTASSIYKGLFSFPYPMFILKVKGFYGKGITYRLALHNTVYEFDANTGNFNITASFIGYKFGIYTDVPMTFLGCAPYMEGGKEYWEQKIASGEFCFRDSNGNPSKPMCTIPELKLKIAAAANNQDAIAASVMEQEMLNIDSKQVETLISLSDMFSFNGWKNVNGKDFGSTNYCFKVFNNIDEIDAFYSGVTDYVNAIKAYDDLYGKNLMSNLGVLETSSGTTEEYIKKNPKLISYKSTSNNNDFVQLTIDDEEHFNKKDRDRVIKLLKSQPNYNNLNENFISKLQDKESIEKWINEARNGQTIFFLLAYEINTNFSPVNLKNALENERKTIEDKAAEQRRIYKEKSALAIENALGFRPSIKNIYDLIFAHMDTFTHTFYESTKRIKDQLEGEKTKRAKDTYNIKDGYTDTENVKIKSSNGSVVENTNARSKYLPPYAAYYVDNNSGSAKGKVLTWLENIPNGSDLEEVSFVNNLINGAETYFKKAKEVEELVKSFSDTGGTGVNMSFTNENTPTPSVSDFIPSTIFDFAFKGKYENPYLGVKKRLSESSDVIESEILTILGLRAVQYINYTRGEKKGFFGGKAKNNSDVFGKIEAINLFKALGDDFTSGFIEFLTKYSTNKNSEQKTLKSNFITSLTGGNSTFNANFLNNATDLNKNLFSSSDDCLLYTYDKGRSFSGNTYTMFPYYTDGIKQLQNAYIGGKEIFNNQQFLPTMLSNVLYSDEENEVTSFVLYDSRDYLSNIYKTFEQEIEIAFNNSTAITDKPSYGDRSGDSYNGLENKDEIISEYKNNVSADELSEEQYYCGVLVHSDGFLKIPENSDVINKNNKDEQSKYNIKYTTFDYTFDDKNPTSIFNNSLYYDQGDNIKSKAFLFLMSSPVIGNEYGFLNENKNGRTLKSLLLREGAFYWYIDTFNKKDLYGKPLGVNWTEIVSKKDFVNGVFVETNVKKNIKKPSSAYELPIYNDEDRINKGISGNKFDIYTYFKLGDNFREIKYLPIGFTPSRKKQLKKFFEEWAETKYKENEEALRNINFYSRDFNELGKKIFDTVSEKKAPKWYRFNSAEVLINTSSEIEVGGKDISIDSVSKVLSDVRNYDNGLDVSFLLNTETQRSVELRELQMFLRDLFLGVCTVFELYSTKDNKNVYRKENRREINTINTSSESTNLNTRIKAEKKYLENIMGGFLTELYTIYNKAITDHKENKQTFYKNVATAIKSNPFKNTDLRLATYMTLKNLYDKWLSFPPYGPEETWCLTRKKKSNSEFDNFIYVDTYYNDIGDKLLVNITKVSEWLSSMVPNSDVVTTEGEMRYTGKTIYEFLTEVAQNCGGNLFAIPQKFAMANSDGVKDMFTPFPLYSAWDEESTGYVFMYTYQPSQHLGDADTSNVDMNGWSPDGDGIDLTDDEIVGSIFSNEKDAYIVPSFAVTFAKQNQSIFKNLQLTTGSMAVTEASIAATFNVAAKTSESPRESVLYGQDLYRIYSNYSYNCSVETMGNMQIMPMMYFQLNNVPFWRGAYQIIKVSHSIEPGNISTKFEGVRINRHAIPMADGAVVIEPVTGDEITNGGAIESGTKITREPNPSSYVGALSTSNFKWLNTRDNPNIVGSIVDTYGKTTTNTSYQKHGMDDLGDNPGNSSYKSKYFKNFDESELGFDPNKVSEKNPIICLLPAHWYGDSTKGENAEIFDNPNVGGKTGEYTWSCKVIKEIHNRLKSEGLLSYLARQPYPNKNERNATGRPAYDLVGRFGSRKVISVMLHWNGGGGSYWCGLMNGTEQTTRLDSVKLMECICEEANSVKERLNLPLMKGGCSVRNYFGEQAKDAGCMPNCAAACTENWFMDFNGKEGKRWLVSNDGIKTIAELHVNGIKQYIKLLQNGPIQGVSNS